LYTDEQLTCTDCGAPFTFSAGEQEFFATKGFQNKPNRCPDCRAARKAQRGSGPSAGGGGASRGGGYGGGSSYGGGGAPRESNREMFSVTCSACGQTAEVPFQPRGDKPVYCRDCFSKSRPAYR
jgi:CxxC-x17-CxxC domain-containing protein